MKLSILGPQKVLRQLSFIANFFAVLHFANSFFQNPSFICFERGHYFRGCRWAPYLTYIIWSFCRKQSSESRWEAIRKKMTASLKNAPIKATATSKMREEKAKAPKVTVKQPLKAIRHQGIPIILHNQKQSEAAEKAIKAKPISANSVHIKLYEKDKEIRAKLESERQKEIERERQMALFKASDAKVLSKRPFMPKQCDKDPVRPRELNLHTDIRSEERQKFDQQIRDKEAEMEAAKQQVSYTTAFIERFLKLSFIVLQEMERREQEEMMDAQKQRELTVHKAAPVRNYKPITIQPSERPVTDPSTPNFSMRRTRHRSSWIILFWPRLTNSCSHD